MHLGFSSMNTADDPAPFYFRRQEEDCRFTFRKVKGSMDTVGHQIMPWLITSMPTNTNRGANGPPRRDVVLVGGDECILSFDLFGNEHFITAKRAFE